MSSFAVERLDHLGLVAGVCQEIGLVEYFDRLDDQAHARVSLGQAVLAMVLNGLGLEHRRLYLIPQFLAHQPIKRLIGPGITADESPRRLPGASAGLAHGPRVSPCCLLGSPIKRASVLESRPRWCMWTAPPSRSKGPRKRQRRTKRKPTRR